MFINLKYVLIVDDAEEFRVLLSNWISFRGLEAITAANGQEASRILEKQRIDLIITDFQMPDMDGLDFLQWCRSHKTHVPVVFITASNEIIPREQIALADCCATHLKKPLDFQILAAALDAAERHEHHRDCLHQPFKKAVDDEFHLTQLGDSK